MMIFAVKLEERPATPSAGRMVSAIRPPRMIELPVRLPGERAFSSISRDAPSKWGPIATAARASGARETGKWFNLR